MGLSDYEKQVLAQMEEQLASDDPHFASKLKAEGPGRIQLNPRRVAWGVVAILVGVVTLLAGVALSSNTFAGAMTVGTGVGVLGFVLMVVGVQIIIRGVGNSGAAPVKKSSSFMQRQQDKWDNRQH